MNNNSLISKEGLNLEKFKKFFLLEFTRQLIKHSEPSEFFELQTVLEKEKEDQKEEKREIIRDIIKEKEKELSTNAKEIKGVRTREIPSIMHASVGMFETQDIPNINPFRESFNRPPVSHFNSPSKISQTRIRLLIPESRFPLHLQYIRPVPMEKEIELGRINPLIKDNKVKIIECYGPGESIVVQGDMGTKKTGIMLDKEEIESTIQRFSRETKIPIQEGIFKVVSGKLIFLAIISEIVGSKFIIKKMFYEPTQQQNYRV
jgi:hypothetical protein